ncbi:MAG TPA: metalloregulator ArsR/SmtB family transcription factor [Chloroflexota bacterium]|nr:metalloregulator ArsR/SmtB family transcription factor [Chloroflexota bacterium]HUM71325.1 metalloregulator ArsR/SmtB family transcription factor [Chloroflexota bacterium]
MNIATPSDPFIAQASYFKALAHPARLQILAVLRQGEACVCHLEAILQKRQAYISQQLMVLKEAGLLAERKEGLFVFYSLADPHLPTILDSCLPATPLPWAPTNGCACPSCVRET